MTRRSLIALTLTGLGAGAARAQMALEEPAGEAFPISHTDKDLLAPEHRKQLVPYERAEHAGALVVEPHSYFLYQVRDDGTAIRYGVGVGREGFAWQGEAQIARKQHWPDWHPPAEMRERQPYLPSKMPGGPNNPLGARALYLFEGDRDTLFRIHGTAEPLSIGKSVSSGCIRMINEDIVDLYGRVPLGTRVIVL